MTKPDAPDDATLRRILQAMRVVAVVGASPNPARPSHGVSGYLQAQGYRVIPVNPGHAGKALFGERVVARVGDLPPEVDTLDFFRRSDHVAPIVRAGLEHLPGLKLVWLQLGVVSDEARGMCDARGVAFIQNRCPRIEIPRLLG
ncbi:MAG: CoA-binding protein [Pararhodobacter sp.]